MRRFQLFFLSFFLLFAPLFAQVDTYETQLVERIDVEFVNCKGNDGSSIRSMMKTRVGKNFSLSDFDDDLKALAGEYEDVEPHVEAYGGRLYITLKVSIKPTVRSFQWSGNEFFSTAKLQKELGVQVGSIFDRAAFNKSIFEVRKYYVKKGFFEATVDYDLMVDPVTNEVDISIVVDEGRSGKIQRVVFRGFSKPEQVELENKLVTQPWNFFYSLLSDSGIYSQEAMLQDEYVIVNYLQNKGFADARVNIEAVQAPARDRIYIVITADRGECYHFGDITIEGNCLFTEEEIRSCMLTKEGCTFSPDLIHETVTQIKNLYGSKGYIDALVEFEPTLDPDCPIYHVNFFIEEGEQFRVGLVKILGNWCTQPNVILHECHLVPGEIFNTNKLRATEMLLRNIGYFSSVNIYAVRADDKNFFGSNYRDVIIEVVETSTGNFSAFVGASSVENVFGGLSVCEKNFNAYGLFNLWNDGLKGLRGGGEYAYFSFALGANSRKYLFSWSKPYFNDTPWIIGFDVSRNTIGYVSNDYELDSWRVAFHAKYPLNCYLRAGWHYRISNSNVKITKDCGERPETTQAIDEPNDDLIYVDNDVSQGDKDSGRPYDDDPWCIPVQLLDQAKNAGLISAAGLFMSYDSTNHPVCPSRGLRLDLKGEFAGIGGDHNFLSIASTNTYYVPTWKRGVLKFRGDAKFIFPTLGTSFRDVPLDERIFLGGINSVRGFRDYSLGPKFGDTNDPTGGISMQLLSVEWLYRLNCTLEPFLFFDMGAISSETFAWGQFQTSTGIGLRANVIPNSPPLILGIGYPINVSPENKDDYKRFFFSLGGNF